MDLSEVLIKRGSIFYSCEFTNIEHGKFFVVIGEDNNNYVGFFFINSNININIQRIDKFFKMQMPVKKQDYSFLKYDSYIDAHAISLIRKDKLKEQISKKIVAFKNRLTKDDEILLLENLRNSDLYSEQEKNIFFK
jgi:hypothetical protein